MSISTSFLDHTKRIQAIAQAGLAYSENPYDIERFEELRDISVELMHLLSNEKVTVIKDLFASGSGYQTPMVDVRAVVFKDGNILMVKEREDNAWALPGGWADIGYTPSEVAVKETKEEAGLDVKVIRLVAVIDKKCHDHPPQPYYIYKLFMLCEIVGGELNKGIETLDVDYFGREELPNLSLDRNIPAQVEMMFEYLEDPAKEVYID